MRRPTKPCRRRIAGVAAIIPCALALSSCLVVGPDYAPPPAPRAEHVTPERPASPGEGQRFAEGKDIPADWWKLFRSKPLDALVRESLDNNPSLQASEAAIGIAYYTAEAQKGAFFRRSSSPPATAPISNPTTVRCRRSIG